ncbi:hypothetical protein [Actinomyces faecalis]|uniref:hypothetical protein n=1 Tax=Actinomyces faecalis TaxID=2722820 RepID=UPI00155761D5|nr:hypothetical protein [Actinomyces faecalis]
MRLRTSWTVDAALFTGGLWNLDLTRVKKNLEVTGWSVNNVGYDGRFDTNPSASRLADVYGYGPAGLDGATIVTPGSDVTVPVDGGASGNGTIHVEIFQYIEAMTWRSGWETTTRRATRWSGSVPTT